MIFGNRESYALEAIIEPGPEYPPYFGKNVTGRVRLFIDGYEVGDFSEPCCVIRALSDHLAELCSGTDELWHESLAGHLPESRFKHLDKALFLNETAQTPSEYDSMIFLTNILETFDDVKGFLVGPPGQPLQALLQFGDSANVQCLSISRAEFCSVAAQFSLWLKEQESELLPIRV
jgi:hypothetical protein